MSEFPAGRAGTTLSFPPQKSRSRWALRGGRSCRGSSPKRCADHGGPRVGPRVRRRAPHTGTQPHQIRTSGALGDPSRPHVTPPVCHPTVTERDYRGPCTGQGVSVGVLTGWPYHFGPPGSIRHWVRAGASARLGHTIGGPLESHPNCTHLTARLCGLRDRKSGAYRCESAREIGKPRWRMAFRGVGVCP